VGTNERQFLYIKEGLKLINGKDDDTPYIEDDLIFKAAIGELTIYVLTNSWNAGEIYEIDHSKPDTDLKIRFTGPEQPPFPNSQDMEELERQNQAYQNWVGSRDAVYGNRTIYGKRGANGGFYGIRMSGHKPIAADTFKQFYEGDSSSKIELNLGKILKSTDSTKEYIFCPDPEVLLQDAREGGKLFVKKDELQKVFSKEKKVLRPKNTFATEQPQSNLEDDIAKSINTIEPAETTVTVDKTKPKFLRIEKVEDLTGMSRKTIYPKIKKGLFPKQHKLGATAISVWTDYEVYDYIQAITQYGKWEKGK